MNITNIHVPGSVSVHVAINILLSFWPWGEFVVSEQ